MREKMVAARLKDQPEVGVGWERRRPGLRGPGQSVAGVGCPGLGWRSPGASRAQKPGRAGVPGPTAQP